MTWNMDSCFVWKVHQGNHTRGWGLGGTEIQEKLEPGKDDIIDPCTTGKRMSESFAPQIATEYLSHAGWQEDMKAEMSGEGGRGCHQEEPREKSCSCGQWLKHSDTAS